MQTISITQLNTLLGNNYEAYALISKSLHAVDIGSISQYEREFRWEFVDPEVGKSEWAILIPEEAM